MLIIPYVRVFSFYLLVPLATLTRPFGRCFPALWFYLCQYFSDEPFRCLVQGHEGFIGYIDKTSKNNYLVWVYVRDSQVLSGMSPHHASRSILLLHAA